MGRKIRWGNLKYKIGKYKYVFQQYETMTSFGESIYTIKINIKEAEMDQTNLSENMVNFNTESRPKTKEAKDKKWNTFDSVSALYEGRELTVNAFTRGIFPIKKKEKERKKRTSFGFSYMTENIKS